MNDMKKLKPTKEMKHLVRILGVVAYAVKTDNLPEYVTEKKVIKSLEYFLPKLEAEMDRMGCFAIVELTEEQERQVAEHAEKMIDIIAPEEGADEAIGSIN